MGLWAAIVNKGICLLGHQTVISPTYGLADNACSRVWARPSVGSLLMVRSVQKPSTPLRQPTVGTKFGSHCPSVHSSIAHS